MPYTFVPKERYAKAYVSLRISTKSAAKLCRAISKKPLTRAKRLLTDLSAEKRTLGTKHYTKTAKEMLQLLNSCEKNAEFLELDAGKLFVHASAHTGTMLRRRRRRAAFGSRMKSTNVELMLIEKGKEKKEKKKADVIHIAGKEDLQKAVEKVAEKIKEEKVKKKSAAEPKQSVEVAA